MGDQHESEYLQEGFQWNTIDQSPEKTSGWALNQQPQWDTINLTLNGSPAVSHSLLRRMYQNSVIPSPRWLNEPAQPEDKISQHLSRHFGRAREQLRLRKRLAERRSEPVTSISSFMAAVAAVNPPFKPRTLYRPWSISAGHGAHGAVEVHRYVPHRNFDVFNNSSSLKLVAYEPDAKRTGDYYAVKRLGSLNPESEAGKTKATTTKASSRRNPYALLADELRILAHPDLRGHPNIVYLFGVSHTPSRGGLETAEPNLVLQEGDCGDLYSFYRDVDMRFNRHTLIEVKLSLCFDIASGIEALHRHGVVHCDIKPQNILIRRRSGRDEDVLRCRSEVEAGQVALQSLMGKSPFVAMLADFGGSIIMADCTGDKVPLKVLTPLWCAPECYSNEPIARSLLPRVDIYSAGLVFAFIFLEGRDIFSQVVERGLMHQYDTTWDRAKVISSKTSGGALEVAKEKLRGFETTVFGITATGQRLYVSRHLMYRAAVLDIFDSILELALQADPNHRAVNATALLEPWHRALQGSFHVNNSLYYSQPAAFRAFAMGLLGGKDYFSQGKTCSKPAGHACTHVPPLVPNTAAGMSLGVFDIRSSFEVFTASLTGNLRTAIVNDMVQEVELVQSIQRHTQAAESIPKSQLRRAADCAYQVGVACLEGFGRPRDDQESLKWLKIAGEWGSPVARSHLLPLTLALGMECHNKDDLAGDPAVQWAFDAVAKNGHQPALNALWRLSQKICTDAMLKYRAEQSKAVQAAFERRTMEKWEVLRLNDSWKAKLRKLHYHSLQGLKGTTGAAHDGGWTLLHYVVALASSDIMSVAMAPQMVEFLVEELGIDVRLMNDDRATSLDLAMANGDTNYLLDRHELCKPPFSRGSCPLQNIVCLPASDIGNIVNRVCKMAPWINIEERLSPTGRTALLNTMLISRPILPPARKAAVAALLMQAANPLATTRESGTASSLLLAVTHLEVDLVEDMLQAIKTFGHTTPVISAANPRPQPANELARAFLLLMQKPRAVGLVTAPTPKTTPLTNVNSYRRSLGVIARLMREHGMSEELRHVRRGLNYDALSLASYYGRDEAIDAILADSRALDSLGAKTLNLGKASSIAALGTSIDCGFAEAADLLLPHMAMRPDLDDHSLILTSAVHHQPALVQRLFDHFDRAGRGQEVLEFQDQWGATILDLALEYGYFDLATFLLGKGAKYDVYRLKGDHSIDDGRQSTLASVLPRIRPIKFLMELTPKPRLVVTSSGLNVFHVLAADEKLIGTTVGRAEFLQVLDYFYALDPSLIHARGGANGFTPFHLVSLHYSEIVGSFLHERGADINAVSAKGHTPLDILHFHDDGDRGVEEHMTVDYRDTASGPRTGIAICDFAMAGPVYWKLEARLARRLKELYKTWGAKRGLQFMMRQLGLQDDPVAAFWSGGITAYYEGSDGEEHSEHFP